MWSRCHLHQTTVPPLPVRILNHNVLNLISRETLPIDCVFRLHPQVLYNTRDRSSLFTYVCLGVFLFTLAGFFYQHTIQSSILFTFFFCAASVATQPYSAFSSNWPFFLSVRVVARGRICSSISALRISIRHRAQPFWRISVCLNNWHSIGSS